MLASRALLTWTRVRFLPVSFRDGLFSRSLFTKVPGDELHVSKPTWWLESRFHFSFAGYWGKNNFGVLRVLNDDLVQPQSGFDTHGHRDMEIYSYVLDGALTHRDSMGNAETLGRGCVQYMSAGTGVTHSEHNRGGDLLRFLQVWIMPNRRSLPPNYGSRLYSLADRQNKLQHVIRGVDEDETNDTGEGVIPIHQDVNVYVSECEPRKSIPLSLKRSRQAYIVCAEGGMEVACGGVKETLKARDALEVRTQGMDADISFTSNEGTGAHFMVIEMASSS
eukprot:jgi/Mesvir1/3851/Mv19816-RA.1